MLHGESRKIRLKKEEKKEQSDTRKSIEGDTTQSKILCERERERD